MKDSEPVSLNITALEDRGVYEIICNIPSEKSFLYQVSLFLPKDIQPIPVNTFGI